MTAVLEDLTQLVRELRALTERLTVNAHPPGSRCLG